MKPLGIANIVAASAAAIGLLVAPAHASPDLPVLKAGVFVGSSPCTAPIKAVLPVTCDAESGLLEWTVTLYDDPVTHAPSRYDLRINFGSTAAGRHGLGASFETIRRQGKWTASKGAQGAPIMNVVRLEGAPSFVQVGPDLIHVLTPDGSLMAGNGGWSFTLNRAGSVEKPADLRSAGTIPEVSYSLAPLAGGPSVSGVFEGRTPCQAIGGDLAMPAHPACEKTKWRLTLFHDPVSGAPTTYRVEGSMFKAGARDGRWSRDRSGLGTLGGFILRLEGAGAERPLLLLRGDDDVLFFLDQKSTPLVGTANFSYTLNRRGAAVEN